MTETEDIVSSCPYCCQPVTEDDLRQRFCPDCGRFLLCAHCRQPVTRTDKEQGKCPNCGAALITPAREAELAELHKRDDEQREKIRQKMQAETRALIDRQSKRHFERLLAISDEEWEAAVEANNTQDEHVPQPILPKKKQTGSRRPEEIEMTCPLCGHTKVMRYPYQYDGWQYVCQGCKCAFNPELES
jgi:DNA-directed RNA polymerase subunit M/transcription elongation factor TFIIS